MENVHASGQYLYFPGNLARRRRNRAATVVPEGVGQPIFAMTMAIAALESRGRSEACGKIGGIALGAMKAYYPIINIFADGRIPEIPGKPLPPGPRDHSGAIRDLHLRIRAASHPALRVMIRRLHGNAAACHHIAPLLVEYLRDLSPAGAAQLVGETLLYELATMHSAVFFPFTSLRAM
jgi:hypothetical protein